MHQINKWCFFLTYLFFSSMYASSSLAAGGGNPSVSPETNTTPNSDTATTIPTNTNTTVAPSTETPPSLNPNSQNFSAFSSSFSGYSSYSSQCGLSISGGYINSGRQDAYQISTTFNTNPCTNQRELEKIRQENENRREGFRTNAAIIITCINARTEAVRNGANPDAICKLDDFQVPRNP